MIDFIFVHRVSDGFIDYHPRVSRDGNEYRLQRRPLSHQHIFMWCSQNSGLEPRAERGRRWSGNVLQKSRKWR